MEYQEFLRHIKSRIEECFPLPNKVILQQILKNNNMKIDSLSIVGKGRRISPVIDLNHYYEEYRRKRGMDDIIQDILHICETQNIARLGVLPDIMNFENIAGKITYRLINRKMNQERLKEIPHILIEDLAKVYVIILKSNEEEIASVIITDRQLMEWNVDLDMINNRAEINTPVLFPYTLRGMNELIRDIITSDLVEHSERKATDGEKKDYEDDIIKLVKADREEEVMYVLSNTKGINGANTLLYPGVLHEFAVRLNTESLYILPSSVHELIILPNQGKFDKESLKGMVMDVNQSQVPTDEILSDEVYYYNRKTDKFTILEN